jgi:hypothetical protein
MNKRVLATLAVALLVGCSDDDEVAGPVPEVDSGTVEDTGGATDTGSTTEDTSTTTDGTVEETTGDGTVTDSTGTDGTPGDVATDTRDSAPAPMIKCGSSNCDPATQACCAGVSGGGTSCIAKAGTCTGTNVGKFECSSADTCPTGQICCGAVGTPSGASCKTSCSTLEIQLCDSNDECAAPADAGDAGGTCSPITGSGSSLGYSRCL